MSTPTPPGPTLFACPVTGCTWHTSETVHDLDSDGASVFAVPNRREAVVEARIAEHAEQHATACCAGEPLPLYRIGLHPDDPGPVMPDDDGDPGGLLGAFTVPDGWAGE